MSELRLICPICKRAETEPYDIGDDCCCGGKFIKMKFCRLCQGPILKGWCPCGNHRTKGKFRE